jgi:hypothetical protein
MNPFNCTALKYALVNVLLNLCGLHYSHANNSMPLVKSKSIFLFVGWGETESTWNVGLLDQPWIMFVEKLVGKNEVLGEYLP